MNAISEKSIPSGDHTQTSRSSTSISSTNLPSESSTNSSNSSSSISSSESYLSSNRAQTHRQSLLKAISWRLVGTLTTFGVTFSLTYSLNIATIVGIIEFLSKILLYYAHERVWIKLSHYFNL